MAGRRLPRRVSGFQSHSNKHDGLLDVGASRLHFRAPSNLLQDWNKSLIAPFEQLGESREVGWERIEVIALIGVLSGKTDDVKQMLSNHYRVRRWLPLFTLAPNRWAGVVRSV